MRGYQHPLAFLFAGLPAGPKDKPFVPSFARLPPFSS